MGVAAERARADESDSLDGFRGECALDEVLACGEGSVYYVRRAINQTRA